MHQHVGSRSTRAVGMIAIALACLGISAAPLRKDHKGSQADDHQAGKWKNCDDAKPKPKPTHLSATYNGETLTLNNRADFPNLYQAAIATCFMEDTDVDHPPGDDRQYADGVTGGATIRLRPAAQLHHTGKRDLNEGEGYFIADYEVHEITDQSAFASTTLGRARIAKGHSALLWLGKDDDGNEYVAVLNLSNFPAKLSSTDYSDVTVVRAGNWIQSKKAVQLSAFARWKDPNGHSLTFNHESSWLSCDTGCCLATGIDILD